MSSFSPMLEQLVNAITMEPWLFIAVLILTLAALFFIARAITKKKKTQGLKPPAQALPKESDASVFRLDHKAKELAQPSKPEPEPLQREPEALKPAPEPVSVKESLAPPTPSVPKAPVVEQAKVVVAPKPRELRPKPVPAKPKPSVETPATKEAVVAAPPPVVSEVAVELVPVLGEAPKKALDTALRNTRGGFMAKLASLFSRGNTISDEDFAELEAILFTADIGARTAQKLLDALRERVKAAKLQDKSAIKQALKEEMRAIFDRAPAKDASPGGLPTVYMFVGVNGAGKTTSIGKLGAQMAAAGKKVYFGAGDTFRAAAVMQLSIWGERSHIPVVTGKENADSAGVLFDAITTAKAAQADVILCDTAGRLHTKTGLMDELKKVHRVLGKALAGAPHEVFLVIDATMGQNAIAQAREFAEATPLTGVVLSKLDGTAKGGVALGIVDELGVPIRFVGVGEGSDDLRPFDADEFIDALFHENER